MLAAMILALVSQWVLQFPMAYALSRPHILGAVGLWWSFPVTNILTAGVAFLCMQRETGKEKRLTEISADQERVMEEAIEDGLPRN